MKFPFLASFIIFIAWLTHRLAHNKKLAEAQEKNFWEKESLANSTRRKPLDDLAYINIPLSQLPVHTLEENDTVKECLEIITSLSERKIVNLTGITNTDLKLQYGAPNITLLTEYDQNYTLLARTLQKWAQVLYDNGYTEETRCILEFAVSTGSDVSSSYKLLAGIYRSLGRDEEITRLRKTAGELNSAMRKPIERLLKEFGP